MTSIRYRVFWLLVLAFVARDGFAQIREITAAAGTGAAGFSGDGGAATSARLNAPSDVTVDSAGNFYIADRDNHRVRKVSASSSVISTIIGNGVPGWFFSGGPAQFASLDRPSGLAIDSAGNVYVADLLENNLSRLSKVTAADNRIHLIELPVILRGAVAIALDNDGNLFIAEQVGHRIRKVDLSSGAITVVAGTGVPGYSGDGGQAASAQVNGPAHLAVDGAGNIYFTDSINNRIRRIAAGSGVITTVVGTGATGGRGEFGGDGGQATAALLNNPRGVAIDGAGNIFIADTGNKRIRRVNAATGVITTVVGGDAADQDCPVAATLFQTPDSLTVNAAGNLLYVADDRGNRIWRVSIDPRVVPPRLTSVTPGSGIPTAIVEATLAGSGFLGGAVATGSGCRVNGTTVAIAGTGVTLRDIVVASDTAIHATFVIAENAALGDRDVTVTTDSGTTAAVPFSVVAKPVPLPKLTSVTPGSIQRGSTGVFTLVGTDFDPRANGTRVSVAGNTAIAVSDIRIANTTSLTVVFTIPADAPLASYDVSVATAGGSSNSVAFNVTPQQPVFVYELPPMLNPTTNAPVKLLLASPFADEVTGQMTLTFAPNAEIPADDPNVVFINSESSARTFSVTFPPNSDTAEFSLPASLLQAGTVAGTIRLDVDDVHVGGVQVAPADDTFDVQVPRLPPVITSVRVLNRSSAGFDVEIVGYSTPREITGATFTFGASSGAKLLTAELKPDVNPSFITYYESDPSEAVGGSFLYLQPFKVEQGSVSAVATVTVSLANSQGSSEAWTVDVK